MTYLPGFASIPEGPRDDLVAEAVRHAKAIYPELIGIPDDPDRISPGQWNLIRTVKQKTKDAMIADLQRQVIELGGTL